MKKIKAIAFDGDGVIVNSLDAHFLAFQKAAQSFDCELTRDDFDNIFHGYKAIDGITRFNKFYKKNINPQKFTQEYVKEVQKIFSNGMDTYSDTLDFIEKIRQGDIEIAGVGKIEKNPVIGLVTMMSKDSAKTMLNQNQSLKDSFQIVISAEDCDRGKPDPEPYQNFLKKAGIDPQETIGVEDSPQGIEALNNAEIFSVAITNTSPKEDLTQAGLVTESLVDIVKN